VTAKRIGPARAAAACAALLAAGAAGAAAAVTGNRAAGAFERGAYASDNRAPGYRLVETGFFTMRSRRTGPGRVRLSLDWGSGVVPSGWTEAIGTAQFALRAGRVHAVELVVRPAGASADPPVEIVATTAGTYLRPFPGSACFVPAGLRAGFVPAPGNALFTAVGRYTGPPERYTTKKVDGGTQTIHATDVQRIYAWGPAHQRAIALDSFVTSTREAFTSQISVDAKPGHPGFTIEQAWTALRAAPAIPRVVPCR
jgi:hypothetical protein